jgi:pilus assembly protein Flp/PilA
MVQVYLTLVNGLGAIDQRLRRDDEGATAVEYGLMVALIAGAIILTVGLLGTKLNTLFGNVTSALP